MELDKQRVGKQFARHYAQYHEEAATQREIAARLDACLAESLPQLRVERGLEIGMGTGFLSHLLTARYPAAHWYFNDLTEEAFQWLPTTQVQQSRLVGDVEQVELPRKLDLIASASAFQWLTDLPRFFARAKEVLATDGILAFSSFGPMNMHELRPLSEAGLIYPSLGELCQLLEFSGFEVLLAREWQHSLFFAQGRDVLDHLRRTGVNGHAATQLWTPARLRRFEEEYLRLHGQGDARVPLTYHPLIILARVCA